MPCHVSVGSVETPAELRWEGHVVSPIRAPRVSDFEFRPAGGETANGDFHSGLRPERRGKSIVPACRGQII
jgi:hypothetical protein